MPDNKKTLSKAAKVLCCLIIAALAASCSTFGKKEKSKDVLKESVEAFNSSFRWEDYNAAAMWIPAGKRELFWKEVDNFRGKIRIIEFQVRDVDHIDKSHAGTAVIQFQYYRTDSPTLEKATLTQKWFFSEKDKGWQLGQSGFHTISKQPPGL